MKGLASLDPSRLDAREHAALCWVRETLTCREGPSADTAERFERAFDERRRRHIVATMKSMYFFNLVGNTMDGMLRRLLGRPEEQPGSCDISWD